MTQQTVFVGTTPNDATGDPIRTAFTKINANFADFYGNPAYGTLFYINTASNPHNADVGLQAASFRVLGYDGTDQFHIETAINAVSYLIIRGGIAGSMPVFIPGGAAADISLALTAKGLGDVYCSNGVGTNVVMADPGEGVGSVNWVKLTGRQAGSPPMFSVDGSDGNIDIYLVPKGTGNVRFGTYTAGVVSQAGYITVKDAGGNTRRLLVG